MIQDIIYLTFVLILVMKFYTMPNIKLMLVNG
jgi:hypothetical protein